MPRSNRSSQIPLFSAAPNVAQYSAIGSIEEARRRLTQTVRDAEGIGLLIGPAGMGKSLVCCLLAESLADDFDVVLLADTRLINRRTLLQNIMFHMELPYQGLSEGELRLALIDRLTKRTAAGCKQALVLIIDEAQSLPARLLEEVRMISNVVRDGSSRVRTVLAGGPELDDRFSQPKLESLSQRIAARCYLHPLSCEETGRYIRDALMRAGEDPQAFIDDEAIVAVHHACAGVPRLISQMMRQAIAVSGGETISGETVQRAWAGLQQLASPIVEVPSTPLWRLPSQPTVTRAAAPSPELPAELPADILEFGLLHEIRRPHLETPSSDNDDPLLASFEIGGGEADPDQDLPRESLAEASPEILAELDRLAASLEELASDDFCRPAADLWDDQTVPTESQTTSDLTADDCCHYVLPLSDADDEIHTLYSEATALPNSEDLLCQKDLHRGDLQSQDDWQDDRRDEPPSPAAASRPSAPWPEAASASLLFGDDFDDEEMIPLPRQKATRRLTVAAFDAKPCAGAAGRDETLLHQEIVRIAAEASRVDFSDDASAPRRPATLPLHLLGSGRPNEAGDDIQLSDDSDLLVVEEGVAMSSSAGHRAASLGPTVDVPDIDFRTLFTRLRQG